jgi:hypothetical protein
MDERLAVSGCFGLFSHVCLAQWVLLPPVMLYLDKHI